MKKLIAVALLALATTFGVTGCAEFKAAGYDVFHEPWGTVHSAADAKCGVVSINNCLGGGNGGGAGSK